MYHALQMIRTYFQCIDSETLSGWRLPTSAATSSASEIRGVRASARSVLLIYRKPNHLDPKPPTLDLLISIRAISLLIEEALETRFAYCGAKIIV
jgi:hypothetical protein